MRKTTVTGTVSAVRIHARLPIFRLEAGTQSVLYTPGHFVAAASQDADAVQRCLEGAPLAGGDASAAGRAGWLHARAREADEARCRLLAAPFAPECLTVYLSNYCNLGCGYCYAADGRGRRPTDTRRPVLAEAAAVAAAGIVAANCARQGRPFSLVVHGGGEPTLHAGLVKALVARTRACAAQHGLEWSGYLATNGVMSRETARWVSRTFDRIGISCDGPPHIQNRQRPTASGGATATAVAAFARMCADAGVAVEVRVTVTPHTVKQQEEIAAYLCHELGARFIRMEPAYRAGPDAQPFFVAADADVFVRNFLLAREKARSAGAALSYAGVRLAEIHGPYCSALRNVLHVLPDNTATACFFSIGPRATGSTVLGRHVAGEHLFQIDGERARAHRARVLAIPPRCQSCINVYHCARGCPDRCVLVAGDPGADPAGAFRCSVNRQLAVAWILERVQSDMMPATEQETGGAVAAGAHQSESGPARARARVQSVRPCWGSAARTLPEPLWRRRGFDHDGATAWQHLQTIAGQDARGPLSVYVHVPFCDRRCGFCDCYSFPFGRHRKRLERTFSRALLREIDAWHALPGLSHRPVTTIHFGGGSPAALSRPVFETVLGACCRAFAISGITERALECTASQLTARGLAGMAALGFTRLHVGVQSLEDSLRKMIGRRYQGRTVLRRLGCARDMGFVVSVDLIYGLPGQSLSGLLRTIEALICAGVHGMSLYRLNVSKRNRAFFRRLGAGSGQDDLSAFAMFYHAEALLKAHGYQKNHFAHFALPPDRNLYFTHAARAEDLLGLGPSADGVFGGHHYRHGGYASYLRGVHEGRAGLEGGVMETGAEEEMRAVVAALMCGKIAAGEFESLRLRSLLSAWERAGLVEHRGQPQGYVLTATGSWYVARMIDELREAVAAGKQAPA